MEKKEFIKSLRVFFVEKGFYYKNNHFYKDMKNDVIIVFGMQSSCYGGYGYLEYGYCFKSINKHLPYPKFNQLNLNCGRIMTDMGKAIVFEKIDNAMTNLFRTIDEIVMDMTNLIDSGKTELIKYYLQGTPSQSWYILGAETAEYFDLPLEVFKHHIVKEI